MKKLFWAAALISCICGKASAEVIGDTLVIEDVKKVKIETRDTVQRIVISGSKEDPQLHYVQRISIPDSSAVRRTMKSVKDFNKITISKKDGKPSKWETSLHVNLGLGTMLGAPDEYKFKVWPSFELGLTWMADWHPFGKKNVWSVGLGLDWHNYHSSNDYYWVKGANDMLMQKPYTESMEDTYTSLHVSSLSLPILYTHYFDNKQNWGLTLGGILNWNFNANANREYEFRDERFDATTKKIGQRPITIDLMAMVHIPSFPNVYFKYSPMKFFKNDRGPEMNQISFGLSW